MSRSVSAPLPLVIAVPDAAGPGSVSAVARNEARELARSREVTIVILYRPGNLLGL